MQPTDYAEAELRVAAQVPDVWLKAGLPSPQDMLERLQAQAATIGELRAQQRELARLLGEVADVLHCHHRNTHKPLLDRVRQARSRLLPRK